MIPKIQRMPRKDPMKIEIPWGDVKVGRVTLSQIVVCPVCGNRIDAGTAALWIRWDAPDRKGTIIIHSTCFPDPKGALDALFDSIAKEHLGIDTLQGSPLSYHALNVLKLRRALQAAYDAGKKDHTPC